jgi:2-oxoglutarate ferredoxin oxidoreductase subunit beta
VVVGENGVGKEDLLVHDMTNRTLATMLAAMEPPNMPVALGILYCDPAESFEEMRAARAEGALAHSSASDFNDLLRRGDTWRVGP